MSREVATSDLSQWGFPRVSGDEPVLRTLPGREHVFSPRERG